MSTENSTKSLLKKDQMLSLMRSKYMRKYGRKALGQPAVNSLLAIPIPIVVVPTSTDPPIPTSNNGGKLKPKYYLQHPFLFCPNNGSDGRFGWRFIVDGANAATKMRANKYGSSIFGCFIDCREKARA
jgi:hypothetical protein